MKKVIICSALAFGMLTACDPVKDEATLAITSVTEETLLEGATFEQYNDEACTEPASDGNYIKFTIPSVSAVTIFYKKADGSESSPLSYGTNSGVFKYVPLRGSDPEQNVYFRYINAANEETVATKVFTLQVAAELSPEVKLLASNSGSKTWYWDPDEANGGRCWGNAGNAGGSWDGSAAWWGCGLIGEELAEAAENTFSEQMNHSGTGNVQEVTYGAYMVFNEDGTVTKYGADGAPITSTPFTVTGWTGGEQTDWVAGKLNVTADATGKDNGVLFPFYINSEGTLVTEFNISILTTDKLVLTYYNNNPGEWGEATWWCFSSSSDYEGMIQGDTGKSWTWDPDYDQDGDQCGRVWGNAGNSGGDWDGSSTWWGCGLIGDEIAEAGGTTFAGQMNHSGTGNLQEVTYGAYMTFFNDGTVAKYGADGAMICQTPYSLEGWTDGTQNNWVAGTLNVSANADGNDNGILFPFYINSEGTLVTSFNVSILTADQMVLTFYNNNPGEWGEATWWRFKAKED